MMTGLPRPTFAERWLGGNTLATVAIALIGWVITTTIWSQQQASEIKLNKENIVTLRGDVVALEHRLSQKNEELKKYIERIDNIGTRSMSLVETNQQRGATLMDRFEARLGAFENRLGIVDNRITQLAEQQGRIVQALDNTYDKLTDLIRQLPPGGRPNQPPP